MRRITCDICGEAIGDEVQVAVERGPKGDGQEQFPVVHQYDLCLVCHGRYTERAEAIWFEGHTRLIAWLRVQQTEHGREAIR